MQSTATKQALDTSFRSEESDEVLKSRASAGGSKLICAFLLLGSDLFTISFVLQLAILTRAFLSFHFGSPAPRSVFNFGHYMRLGWIFLPVPFFYAVEGLYTQRRTMWKEVGFVTKATGLGLIAILAAAALGKHSEDISRITILLLGANLLVLMPLSRYLTKWLLGTLGLWRKRLLVLGAADTAQLALRGLDADPILGYQVIGVLDDDPTKQGLCTGPSSKHPVYVLGPLSEAVALLRRNEIKDVLIAIPDLPEDKLLALVYKLQGVTETVYLVPNLWGLPMMNLQLDGFLDQQVQMLKLSNNLAKPWNGWLKRSLDIVFASLLAVVTLPLMGLIALLIRLDSRGPALLGQRRIGHRGKDFTCWKFRTMYIDGDKKLATYFSEKPHLLDEWHKYAKLKTYDPRLTRIGRVLRRWSLDELPQIINTLKGDMSLVGPRPYLPRERDRIGSHLPIILEARPGMTGFWQVSGKNKLTFEDRVRLEVWYVRNWSSWFDLIILIKTVWAVLREDHSG
jgi:undecaprenyl-phosphate galactose phosphotransferase